jgi:hypothetical protein
LDKDQTTFSAMRDKVTELNQQVAELQIKNAFMLNELRVCQKGFEHHGLDGMAWLAGEAIAKGCLK